MAGQSRPATPEEVVEKVLRRVEVAQMARKLQDRLAFASYKTQNGLDNYSLDLVEAHLENTLKRKRPAPSISTSSDSSSTTSDRHSLSGPLTSSPHTAALFSDDFPTSTNSHSFGRRSGYRSNAPPNRGLADYKRSRTQSMAPPLIDVSRRSWKGAHNLPESSPGLQQLAHFPSSHAANLSFASDASTIPNTPSFGPVSDDKIDQSFSLSTSHFRSSPPCTPPPTHSRRSRTFKRNAAGEEGAELLMHLATSPSPANQGLKSNMHPPSTPPSDHQALPSSMMPMSGASGFLGGLNTPGQNFAWADFINVTPSPAQGAFGNRTPGLPKTPLAAKEARRRLNLDALGSSAGSPTLSNIGRGSTPKNTGLGMELGGELVS
ncbi:MAG: hypothetical protein Q9208_001775 [Pyrenodesmia sp. 3 TL-2023]